MLQCGGQWVGARRKKYQRHRQKIVPDLSVTGGVKAQDITAGRTAVTRTARIAPLLTNVRSLHPQERTSLPPSIKAGRWYLQGRVPPPCTPPAFICLLRSFIDDWARTLSLRCLYGKGIRDRKRTELLSPPAHPGLHSVRQRRRVIATAHEELPVEGRVGNRPHIAGPAGRAVPVREVEGVAQRPVGGHEHGALAVCNDSS
jgi:hypothetical protein